MDIGWGGVPITMPSNTALRYLNQDVKTLVSGQTDGSGCDGVWCAGGGRPAQRGLPPLPARHGGAAGTQAVQAGRPSGIKHNKCITALLSTRYRT